MLSDSSTEWEIPSPQTAQTMGEACRRYSKQLIAFAQRLLRRERIPESEYSPEDSVQSGFRMLLTSIVKGKLESVESLEACFSLLRRAIAQKVIAERNRKDATKRGGHGIRRGKPLGPEPASHDDEPPARQVAADFDLLESGLPEPEVMFISEQMVAQLSALLTPEQAKIVDMRLGSLSNAVIARSLDVTERTIERRFEEIRLIWSQSGLIDPD